MKISLNSSTYSYTGKNYLNKQNKQANQHTTSDISFGAKPKMNNALAIGGGVGVTAGTVYSIVNRKAVMKGLKNIAKKIDNFINPNKVRQMDVSGVIGKDLDKQFKQNFIKEFVNTIKQPFTEIRTDKGMKKTNKLKYVPNGLMLTGPDSKAKEDCFEWMIDEMRKAGAEIIDPGKGKKAKFDDIHKEWWSMWNNNNDEQFKKTGKYRVFVVRGLDEIGQPSWRKEQPLKFPEASILKDSPDSNESATRHGIMLFYTCKDTSKVDPAVIRKGRIDTYTSIQPYSDEPLDIWKEYLVDTKWGNPPVIVNKIESAKKVLNSRGDDVMKEMEPYFRYSVPYIAPKADAPLKTWQEYVNKQAQDVDRNKCNSYLADELLVLQSNLPKNEAGREKFNAVVKMTEDIQKPEDLKQWRKQLRFKLGCDDIAYDEGQNESAAERSYRILKEQGRVDPFTQRAMDRVKDLKKD